MNKSHNIPLRVNMNPDWLFSYPMPVIVLKVSLGINPGIIQSSIEIRYGDFYSGGSRVGRRHGQNIVCTIMSMEFQSLAITPGNILWRYSVIRYHSKKKGF